MFLIDHLVATQLKNKTQQLRTLVEIAEKIHSKEKTKYQQMGDTCLRLRGRMDGEEGQQPGVIRMKMVSVQFRYVRLNQFFPPPSRRSTGRQ